MGSTTGSIYHAIAGVPNIMVYNYMPNILGYQTQLEMSGTTEGADDNAPFKFILPLFLPIIL